MRAGTFRSSNGIERDVLRVRDAWYRPSTAPEPLLKGVSMSLVERKLALLVGRSGAGKSTLLHVLAGLYELDRGDVMLHDRKVGMEGRLERVGIVFQFPNRHFVGRDVGEELTFSWPRGWQDGTERRRRARRLRASMEAVGLEHVPLDQPLESFSEGYQRRIAIASQLARKTQVLLMDEPFAGLDWKTKEDLVQLLRGLKKETTILVASHDVREIASIVDDAWEMEDGALAPIPWPPMPGDRRAWY